MIGKTRGLFRLTDPVATILDQRPRDRVTTRATIVSLNAAPRGKPRRREERRAESVPIARGRKPVPRRRASAPQVRCVWLFPDSPDGSRQDEPRTGVGSVGSDFRSAELTRNLRGCRVYSPLP